jgi:hypothetical protein
MALTNERRAHDLAIALLNFKLADLRHNIDLSEVELINGEQEITIHVEEIYLESYNSALSAMQRLFPE